MGTIRLEDIRVFAYHGVLPEERESGQLFLIDVELELERESGGEDDLSSTVDYGRVAKDVVHLSTANRYELIETLAEELAGHLLQEEVVRRVSVTVKKPGAPLEVPVGCVSATAERTRREVEGK